MKNQRLTRGLAGLAVASLIAAACGGSDESSDSTDAPTTDPAPTESAGEPEPAPEPADGEAVELDFSTWANPAEEAAFNTIIANYEAANPNVTVNLDVTPPPPDYTNQVDVALAGGTAPDIVRGGFVGMIINWAKADGVIDLAPYLEDGFTDDYQSPALNLMSFDGSPHALPLHQDTIGLFYNKKYFEEAGLTPPATGEECWDRDTFLDNSTNLIDNTDAEIGFSHFYNNGKRYLSMVFDNGGQLYNDELSASQFNEAAAIETIEWTQRWFDEGHVSDGNTMKGSDDILTLFSSGRAAMMMHGFFIMPSLADQMDPAEWGVTHLPCSMRSGADVGGTGIAVTRDAENPEVAADFVKFLTSAESQAIFAADALFIPTRQSVIDAGMTWSSFQTEMEFFANEVMPLINPDQAVTMAQPTFPGINGAMANEIELAWTSGQSAEDTAANIAAAVDEALAG